MTSNHTTELLFSYGTLQLEPVQLTLFGRRLVGTSDVLPRFKETLLEIDDEATVRMSGKTHHAMAEFSGDPADAIHGTGFELTLAEVESADKYEVAAYKRVAVMLGSGRRAWAYVDAQYTPAES
jgi:hypothetical protein